MQKNANAVQVLQPRYLKQFVCNGAICEDNCCIGTWNIYVDRGHYHKYKNLRDKRFEGKINNHVKRVKGERSSEDHYGKLIPNEQKHCTFLSNHRLCTLQQCYGDSMLPYVCQLYPRIILSLEGQLQRSLSFSCPLAAQQGLLLSDGMEFEFIDMPLTSLKKISARYDSQLQGRPIIAFAQEIQAFCIQIMKSRDYQLWERLLILVFFLEKLHLLEQDGRYEEVPLLIEEYSRITISGLWKDSFNSIPPNHLIKVKLLKEISDDRFVRGIVGSSYYDILLEVTVGLGYVDNYQQEDVLASYETIFNNKYLNWLDKKGYVLENYLTNYLFQHVFPFGMEGTIWDNAVLLVMHYALIQLHIIGLLGTNGELDDQKLLKCIQSFVKNYEHNQVFERHMNRLLEQNGIHSKAHMAILLKD